MPVDYDLVVIGSSAAGIYAAVSAANLNARVALVEQGCAASSPIDGQVLTKVGQTLRQLCQAAPLGLGDTAALPSTEAAWTHARQWSAAVTAAIAETHAPAVLASLGIEVIAGCGEFHRKPMLGFMVNGRSLRSRAYLLAIEPLPVMVKSQPQGHEISAPPALAEIDGLALVGYLDASSVLQKIPALEALHRLVIIGADAIGVELAQNLVRLGRSVTLIVATAHVLPHEDAEAAFLIQALLEAEGVEVLTETTVTQVRQIDGKKWVQAGNRAIDADEIILTATTPFDQATLNLAAANVEASSVGIGVNEKLQTTNACVYACRGSSAGDRMPHLALADARIAVKNALFLPIAKINDAHVPHIVSTAPALARVGQTEAAAIQRFGKDVVILRQPFKTLIKAQIQGETIGFCKLIVHRNGTLLGAHIVGSQADELIGTIALAIQQKLNVEAIADLVLPSSSLAEIIHQTAAEWHHLRLQQNTRLRDFLEGFFNWRRSMN
ncbi:FAD-dependent oxidoreductase [Stenomitos frigidus]|uniref:Mercuric reductase n=1 Tax=Stenomitos frigidus ULC18 TaxID=2107698 RepID=A0A2T1E751_9CYAN|nr:FAD-dependent oxidoreductase [Stenomitos frigidus]PSB28569.1 mercuric reductase [Stenomitos frigidus ULC18]